MAAELIENSSERQMERIIGEQYDKNEIMKHHPDLMSVNLTESKWNQIRKMITFPGFINDYIVAIDTFIQDPHASREKKLELLAIITALKIFSTPKCHLSECIRDCFTEILALRTTSTGIPLSKGESATLAAKDKQSILNEAELYRPTKEPLDPLLNSIKMMLNSL